jgi:uncharacterized protein
MDNQTILKDLKDLLQSRYGDAVIKVILFGSRVDDQAPEYSDYDILIVFGKDIDWRMEKEIIALCYDIDLKYDIVTDIKIISRNDLNTIKGKEHYILNALESGIAV